MLNLGPSGIRALGIIIMEFLDVGSQCCRIGVRAVAKVATQGSGLRGEASACREFALLAPTALNPAGTLMVSYNWGYRYR